MPSTIFFAATGKTPANQKQLKRKMESKNQFQYHDTAVLEKGLPPMPAGNQLQVVSIYTDSKTARPIHPLEQKNL